METEGELGSPHNEYTPNGRFTFVPPDQLKAPQMAKSVPVRHMTAVIRGRQNAVADYYDEIGEYYEWEVLRRRWYPPKSVKYIPRRDYHPDEN